MLTKRAAAARATDPEPALFDVVYELLQRTAREIQHEDGSPYNAGNSYRDLYDLGAREAVEKSVLKSSTSGFGKVGDAGRLDLSYEWLVLRPDLTFGPEVKRRAWERLDRFLATQQVVAR